MWAGTIEKDLKLDNFIQEDMKKACRQSLPVYYRLNGAIYIGKVKAFEQNKSFLGRNSIAYIMPQEASIDIDTSLDFEYAEFFMKKMNRNI